jgi:hypothetical protein
MFCPLCGVAAQPGQKFCSECGAALPELAPASGEPLRPPSLDELATPPRAMMPLHAPGDGATAEPDLPPTQAIAPTEAAAPSVAVYNQALDWDTGVVPEWNTAQQAVSPGQATAVGVAVAPAPRFRYTPFLATSIVLAAVAVVAAVLDQVSYRVTGDAVAAAHLRLNDLSSNLLVGAIIGAVLAVVGGVLSAAGVRFGSGLVGGAGLALAGMFVYAVGQGLAVLDAVQVTYLHTLNGTFTVTTTREVGFYLSIAAAVVGGALACWSLVHAGRARIGINPVVGALGALGALAIAIGTLIPQHGASLGDNFSQPHLPPATLYLRLLCLTLIAVGGVLGFLISRPWGLGIALGTLSIGVWQTITALAEAGDRPFPLAGGNFVASPAHPFQPHVVVLVGMGVALLSLAAGLIGFLIRRSRLA